ncbi:MAG: glycosyltransferase [Alphaproteobacteria bacterium]|nr:glycosyltransferase [Alphaproteobacteria bacterium]
MRVVYCHDNEYIFSAGGAVYAAGQFASSYWDTYLKYFDDLEVLGRKKEGVPEDAASLNRSDAPHVSISGLPNMNSPVGMLQNSLYVKKRVEEAVQRADAVIIRTMSEIGWLAYQAARKYNKPFAMEMAGCPWDNMWHHGSLIARAYAPLRYHRARLATGHADAVIYVTNEFLQSRYPAAGILASASNVRIHEVPTEILEKRKARITSMFAHKKTINIGLIGALHNKLKGIQIALRALAQWHKETGTLFRLNLLGPGHIDQIMQDIQENGLEGFVVHEGLLPSGEPVQRWLDQIDVYLQPSFHEGLPRAVIEAMSRGCPVLASTTGGIPELLPLEWLHKPGDVDKLAQTLKALLYSEAMMQKHAAQNYMKARDYTADKLEPVRNNFWSQFARYVEERNANQDLR